MSKVGRIAVIAGVLIASALAAAIWTWKPWSGEPVWTEEEAMQAVLKQYPGDITSAVLEGQFYRIEFISNTGQYRLFVDAHDGSIQSVERTGKPAPSVGTPGSTIEPGPTASPSSSAGPSPAAPTKASGPSATPKPTVPGNTKPPVSEAPVLITANEAGKLAAQHVMGTVDDVELGRSNDYLVEIDTGDGREAVVQVNAISGAIMSVAWDDDDGGGSGDDSDDDDDDN
jgi:uncharacterized membrane protein YkoI